MSYYRNQLEEWLKTISVNADHVLDLGGASNPVRNRVKSFEAGDVIYFDNGAEEAKMEYIPFDINLPLTQLKGYEAYLQQEEFGMPNPKNPFRFDALFCLEVFEYVWNPVQAMQNIYDLMTDDAVAYISFPSIYPVHQPVEIDFLRYTKAVIFRYLTSLHFTQIEITPRIATQGRQALQAFYSLEGMHPVRKSELPFDIGYLVKARKLNLV